MATVYTEAAKLATNDALDWTGDTFEVTLLSDNISYTPDPDGESIYSDVIDGSTATEFNGANYSSQTLSNKSVDTSGTNEIRLQADDVNFGVLDADGIQGVLISKQAATASLICYLDGGDFPYVTDGTEDITITFPSNEIAILSV
jgi:hypothetical protein